MKYKNLREEELKNKIAQDFFSSFDCSSILSNIDFAVIKKLTAPKGKSQFVQETLDTDEYYLWAEAKAKPCEPIEMMTQLVLTIGKARTFENILPPPYLGCFDYMKIAFVPYYEIQEVFYLNDFDWTVTSSNSGTKEFRLIYEKLETLLTTSSVATPSGKLQSSGNSPLIEGWTRSGRGEHFPSTEGNLSGVAETAPTKLFIFHFEKDEKELRTFIKDNFVQGKSGIDKIQISKNNFTWIYAKWCIDVKPTIGVRDWGLAKQHGVYDLDFYLADMLSTDNLTFKEKLKIILYHTQYEVDRHINNLGFFSSQHVSFTDGQKAHSLFWTRCERPPREEYWDFIMDRRDLLVPQDVRERKGSFFTPQIWVELSQRYITKVFGENWQDAYYIWDCAAGTGNLLTGLTNKYNIWASTLDKADVKVIHERILNGANLLEKHVFQFDFLNDDFETLPPGLLKIIRKAPEKLIIYINPPYAEVSSIVGGKAGVNQSKTHTKYTSIMGTAGRELYTQFLTRIYKEIKGCKIAEFSTLKTLQGSAFEDFRSFFHARLERIFVVPANTFDNVKGSFPIGFKIWDTSKNEPFNEINSTVYDHKGSYIGNKIYRALDKCQYINKWISYYKSSEYMSIGFLAGTNGNDFQHNNIVYVLNRKEQMPNPRGIWVNKNNLIPVAIYLAVRRVLPATWLNDRDQFLHPNDGWKKDIEFQNNCLTFTLFSNNIQSQHGINHWIPFTETEVNAQTKFQSRFMTDFISGKITRSGCISNRQMVMDFEDPSPQACERAKHTNNSPLEYGDLTHPVCSASTPLQRGNNGVFPFSSQAQAVFTAGRELWRYYHSQNTPSASGHSSRRGEYNVNASYYDIREHFQSRDNKGRMKNTSDDERYTALMSELRHAMRILAKQIEPKIYKYGFLKE